MVAPAPISRSLSLGPPLPYTHSYSRLPSSPSPFIQAGSGKSSTLNSLLGERAAPVSAFQAPDGGECSDYRRRSTSGFSINLIDRRAWVDRYVPPFCQAHTRGEGPFPSRIRIATLAPRPSFCTPPISDFSWTPPPLLSPPPPLQHRPARRGLGGPRRHRDDRG